MAPLGFAAMETSSSKPYIRNYLMPPQIVVTSEPTEADIRSVKELHDICKNLPDIETLQHLVRTKNLALLVASGLYTFPGETIDDNGARHHVVGSLFAPIFIGNHAEDDDIDAGELD